MPNQGQVMEGRRLLLRPGAEVTITTAYNGEQEVMIAEVERTEEGQLVGVFVVELHEDWDHRKGRRWAYFPGSSITCITECAVQWDEPEPVMEVPASDSPF